MKMCSISVDADPVDDRDPGRVEERLPRGRRQVLAGGHGLAQASGSVAPAASIALYAVGAVEQIVTPCSVISVASSAGRRLLDEKRRGAGVQREEQHARRART